MRISYLFLGLILLVACSKVEDKTTQVENSNPAIDSLDIQLTKLFEESQLPGFAVAILDSNQVYYQKGFGFADREQNRAYTPQSVQLIASISKTFVGVSLMKALEDNLLSLDDDINDYLPFKVISPHFPGQTISLRHLASHTSGIEDPEDYHHSYIFSAPLKEKTFPPAWHKLLPAYDNNQNMPLGKFLKEVFEESGKWYHPEEIYLNWAAGTQYNYSNLGISLLGYIIERATGESFSDYSQKNILQPLKMDKTTWSYEEVDQSLDIAYYLENQALAPDYQIVTYPDGGLYSSVEDLAKFLQEMIKGYTGNSSILKPTSFQEMMRKQFPGEDLTEGLCWDLAQDCCIGHAGNDFGTSTMMYFSPKTGIGKILFTNITLETEDLESSFYEVFNLLFAYDANFVAAEE